MTPNFPYLTGKLLPMNHFLLLLITVTAFSCQQSSTLPSSSEFKIAFGSCGHQDHPLPIFHEVVKQNPDLFIFLGDNIYGDTKVMDTLRAKYNRLSRKESFQALKAATPMLATWDDHDFGWNDAGRHYEFKEEAKEIFMDFFEISERSPMRSRPGIYDSHTVDAGGKTIQIILLDSRTFRDRLARYDGRFDNDRRYFYSLDYRPYDTADSTLLGEAQWNWLEAELTKEADLRIIASSTQFGIEFNGYEAWANFPHEQQRFLDLIQKTKASGVLFLSGDVHYAEISKLEEEGLYPIYDLTSSGLSSTWHFATPNRNRIEGPIMDNHFGLLTMSIETDPKLSMEIWDIYGNQRIEYAIRLSDISF